MIISFILMTLKSDSGMILWVEILMLVTLRMYRVNGGQFRLSTQLIMPNHCFHSTIEPKVNQRTKIDT